MKSVKNKKVKANGSVYTEVTSMQPLYINSKKGKNLRKSLAEYLNFVKDKVQSMSKQMVEEIKLNYPFFPDDLFSKKQTFFILPASLL